MLGPQTLLEALQNIAPAVSRDRSLIDKWANFLAQHKLTPQRTGRHEDLISLAETLAKSGASPAWSPYPSRLAARQSVVQTAMDLGIDLASMKHRSGTAMDRGMLDAWNAEYLKRFGGLEGTPGAKELLRRQIVTKLANERRTQ